MPPPKSTDEPARCVEYPMAPEGLNFVIKGRSTDEPAYTLAGVTGSTARAPTMKFDKLLVEVVQLVPPMVVLNTPVLTGVQVLPLSMDLKTPVENDVPAYTVVGVAGSTTIELTSGVVGRPFVRGNPAFSEVQFAPPLIVLNIPLEPP